MGIENSTDLIERLQIYLRTQTGLPTFNETLPELPSLRQSISTLHSSLHDNRCPYCSGSLLRGPDSLLCIYCGKSHQPKTEDPIKFTSTLAYRWLLSSLQLNGSEIIEPSIDEQAPNRGQNTPKDKIPLSDLLNLEIPWLTKPEITENSLSKNATDQSKSMTNTGVVDLDNLFTYAKDLVSDIGEERAITNKEAVIMKSNDIDAQKKLAVAPKFQNPVKAVNPSEEKGKDFSSWEADFQSADFDGQPEQLKFSVPLESNEPKDVSTPSVSTANDWTQSDLWNKSTVMTEQVETSIQVKDRVSAGTITPPENSNRFPDDDQWQTHSKVATENNPTGEDVDSFDVWDNFASSSKVQDKGSFGASEVNPPTGDVDSSDVWDNLASYSKTQEKGSFGAIKINPSNGDDDSSDVWDDFTSFSNTHDLSEKNLTSTKIGLTNGDNKSPDVCVNITSSSNAQDPSKRSLDVSEINPTTVDDDSSDVWDDFTSFSNARDPSKNYSVPTGVTSTTGDNESSEVWENITSSSNAQDPFSSSYAFAEMKATTVDDDSSDVWDDFTSSSNAHGHSKSSFADLENKTTVADDGSSDVWDDFTSSSDAHGPPKSSFADLENKATAADDNSSDVWDGFISSSNAHDPFKSSIVTTGSELTTGVDKSSDVWDGFTSYSNANDSVKSPVTIIDNKPATEVDYSSDVWDFTSSSNAHDPFKDSITSPITSTNNKTTNLHVDSSDFWDDFTSSSVQNPSNSYNTHIVKEIASVSEQTIDTTFPSSSDNFQRTDFGSFLQSDVPFGLVSNKNGPVEVVEKQSKVSSSNRMSGKGEGGSNLVAASDDVMENLFSQMHDLSFMLKTELSLPSVKDDPDPSQDVRPGS